MNNSKNLKKLILGIEKRKESQKKILFINKIIFFITILLFIFTLISGSGSNSNFSDADYFSALYR
jgi:hypothetical protein